MTDELLTAMELLSEARGYCRAGNAPSQFIAAIDAFLSGSNPETPSTYVEVTVPRNGRPDDVYLVARAAPEPRCPICNGTMWDPTSKGVIPDPCPECQSIARIALGLEPRSASGLQTDRVWACFAPGQGGTCSDITTDATGPHARCGWHRSVLEATS